MAETKSTTSWFEKRTRPLWREYLLPRWGGYRKNKIKQYIEVGVYEGASMLWVLENLLAGDGIAVGIDHWQPHRRMARLRDRALAAKELAHENLRQWMPRDRIAGVPLVLLWENNSRESLLNLSVAGDCDDTHLSGWWTRQWLDNTDLIFIDGGHMAPVALTDLVLSWHLLRKGGVLVLDDIHIASHKRRSAGQPKVAEACAAFESCFRPKELYRTKEQISWVK